MTGQFKICRRSIGRQNWLGVDISEIDIQIMRFNIFIFYSHSFEYRSQKGGVDQKILVYGNTVYHSLAPGPLGIMK